jgi:hypothetical protein
METIVKYDDIEKKYIIDRNTGKPIKEAYLEGNNIVLVKEDGQRVEVPLNTVRGKHIYDRLTQGIAEITGAIYV